MLQPKVAEAYELLDASSACQAVDHPESRIRYAVFVVMGSTYDKVTPTLRYSNPEIVVINRSLVRFNQAVRHGVYLMDTYPILQYVSLMAPRGARAFESQFDTVREKMVTTPGDLTTTD